MQTSIHRSPRRGDRAGSADRIATLAPSTGDEPHTCELPPEGRDFHRHGHIRTHKTHAEEGRDLNDAKEQQKQRFPRHAPSTHRAKFLAKTINQ